MEISQSFLWFPPQRQSAPSQTPAWQSTWTGEATTATVCSVTDTSMAINLNRWLNKGEYKRCRVAYDDAGQSVFLISASDPDPLTETALDSIWSRIRCTFYQSYHTWSNKVLLTFFLEEELPMAWASRWVRYSLLKIPTFFVFFISLGIWFQLSTTLLEKKFLLTSSLTGFGLRISGPSVLWIWIGFGFFLVTKREFLLHSERSCINVTRKVMHGSFSTYLQIRTLWSVRDRIGNLKLVNP